MPLAVERAHFDLQSFCPSLQTFFPIPVIPATAMSTHLEYEKVEALSLAILGVSANVLSYKTLLNDWLSLAGMGLGHDKVSV